MEFSEKFIERNIGELAERFQTIHAYNINTSRICPDLIDGLKPVVRRALYMMSLVEGGKTFRKLATISGDVFGHVHPHCLEKNTTFILTDGTKKTIEEMYNEGGTFESYSFDSTNDLRGIINSKISNVRITKYVNELYEIKFTNGTVLRCTDDHQHLVMRDCGERTVLNEPIVKPTWVDTKDIEPGDLFHGGELLYSTNKEDFKISDFGVKKESDKESLEYLDRFEKYHFPLVDSINIVKYDKPEPVYDFTVDVYENAMVYIGSRDDSHHSFIFTHNSPVAIEDAIINVAQEWRNSIPLVEGDGNFGTCFDPETEVLCIEDDKVVWKKISEYASGEIASVNKDTGEWIWEEPTEIITYDFAGKMIKGVGGGSSGNALGNTLNDPPPPGDVNKFFDFMVTPDHKMLLKDVTGGKDTFDFIEAKDFPDVSKLMSKVCRSVSDVKFDTTLPNESTAAFGYPPPEDGYDNMSEEDKKKLELETMNLGEGLECVPVNSFFEILSLFLAYGEVDEEGKISLVGADDAFLEKMGIEDPSDVQNDAISAIVSITGQPLGKTELPVPEGEEPKDPVYIPVIPKDIFFMDDKHIKKFIEAYNSVVGGGGAANGITLKAKVEQLCDQLQVVAMMASYVTQFGETEDTFPFIVQGMKDFEPTVEKKKHITEEEYEGPVFCVTMPSNHTLVVRREKCPLICGNCSGDRAGASRYIKARLSDYSIACFFEDWKDSVVDMELAYDEHTKMPLYLPAKYPNILLNGCLGIGYGLSSNIPAFNFREVVEATIMLMANSKAKIVLIPDSPTGADIIENDFAKICDRGVGTYKQRCTYTIDPESNTVTITSLPDLTTANDIREKIADIKEKNGLHELIAMNDLSGKTIKIDLIIRDDVNPYKFMKKLIQTIPGLERSYPVNITVSYEYMTFDYSIRDVLLEWIKWRREQKRASISNKRSEVTAEQRVNDIKIFILNGSNLRDTIEIFKTSRNRQEIEDRLIAKYHNTEIRMDSLQARALSNMRMIELTIEAYEGYKKRAEELEKELAEIEEILNTEKGIDKVIIAELRDGIKRFGKPRRSNVVPNKISCENEVEGICALQLSSDGNIVRIPATNAEEEPIPTDSNGFACLVDNDASFILVDDTGHHTFIRVKDLPIETEVPVFRYTNKPLDGNIVAMLPCSIDSNRQCILISRKGIVKRIRISEIGPSKKPCITIDKDDKIVRGIVLKENTSKDLLIYTKSGLGQRISPDSIRITSPLAKGINGFKMANDDEICGVYAISPEENAYLLYVTAKGKMRLNNIEYLPKRESKHDTMVRLITLNDRDKLVAVIGCNKLDKVAIYFDDSDCEEIEIKKLPESTMSSEPKKMTKKNAVSSNVTKVKLI